MDKNKMGGYLKIMHHELVLALGCTEPGAVAFAAAKATSLLGKTPESMDVCCSSNIIKNVKSVNVPNAEGLRGIEAAAILGMLVGEPDKELQILDGVKPEDVKKTKELLAANFCRTHHQKGEEKLYINVVVRARNEEASATVEQEHTNVTRLTKNGEVIYDIDVKVGDGEVENLKNNMSVKDIFEFASSVDVEKVKDILDVQIKENCAIAEEGVVGDYGLNVGESLMDMFGDDIKSRASAMAAAGSDARMAGSSLPVVVNSGSGNQGITVTVPVVEYAEYLREDREKLYRALCISNLIALHIKSHIGPLSAFCGATSAACGSGAAIAYLQGGGYDEICSTITNTLANVSGIICDGAKASCAFKIATSVNAALLGCKMAMDKKAFTEGDGIVGSDIEETIRNIGRVGNQGMRETDNEIIDIMIGNGMCM